MVQDIVRRRRRQSRCQGRCSDRGGVGWRVRRQGWRNSGIQEIGGDSWPTTGRLGRASSRQPARPERHWSRSQGRRCGHWRKTGSRSQGRHCRRVGFQRGLAPRANIWRIAGCGGIAFGRGRESHGNRAPGRSCQGRGSRTPCQTSRSGASCADSKSGARAPSAQGRRNLANNRGTGFIPSLACAKSRGQLSAGRCGTGGGARGPPRSGLARG